MTNTTDVAPLSDRHDPHESQERQARRLFDEMARNIRREAVNHLKKMYPAALGAVPKSAETSLTNRLRASIDWRKGPLPTAIAMIVLQHERDEE